MSEVATENTSTGRRSKRGGSAARRAARSEGGNTSGSSMGEAAWMFKLHEMGDEETLAQLEENADTILQEVGVDFRDDDDVEPDSPNPLTLFKQAGCDIKDYRVRFPRGLARKIIQDNAPREYTQHARNSANNVIIGGRRTVFAPVYGPPFIVDLDGERRYTLLEDFQNLVKMNYMTKPFQHAGGTVCEPTDIPVNKRHLDMLYAHMRFSDKPYMGSVTHWSRAHDSVKMSKILFGDDFVDNNTVMTSLINVNSPLVYDSTMLGALKVYAQTNQACLITPFVLSGAMAPCTIAGSAAQILAEAMAGMALVQLIRPGAPVIFGSFVTSMSMQSGAPTFGTPEPAIMMNYLAHLSRRLGVPFRTGGAQTASKIADAQAAYESNALLWSCLPAGVNFLLHSGGWLEGGLSFSYEKFLMDAEQISSWHSWFKGLDMSDNGQAMDTLLANPPGQHHLGTEHTQRNFQTAFWSNPLADNNSFEQWKSEGSSSATERANKLAREKLASYEAPPLDEGKDEELKAYIAERKGSMADAWSS